MLTFLVIGLFQGAVYGLLAVGLVLVYKGTRVFNFAQGEFGSVAALMTYYALTYGLPGLGTPPYMLAALVGVAAALLLGLAVERVVIRPLLDAPRLTVLVATVGVALFVSGIAVVLNKNEVRTLEPAVGGGASPIGIFGAAIVWQQILVVGVLLLLAGVLAFFFSRTNQGLAVLATSQDAFATRVVGISVPKMSRFIWGFAALLGAIAGILQAPIGSLYPGFMTREFLIPAFTGAVLGGMTSLPGAFLGGELVGVAQNLGIYFFGQKLEIPGASDLTVLVLLLAVLLSRPQGLLGKEA